MQKSLRTFLPDLQLLLAALIWGFAFVAQRVGMQSMPPLMFNGVRFLLGGAALWVASALIPALQPASRESGAWRRVIPAGLLAGLILFGGASLQQMGIVYTTAGKAGFITGLYVVLVPLVGLLWGQKTGVFTWLGAGLAAGGLYLLSVTETFTLAPGDGLVLLGALFWTAHVLLLGWLTRRVDPVRLSVVQFFTCGVLSLAAGFLWETVSFAGLFTAALPLLYGGLLSVGVGYTLQTVAQSKAKPSHAAVLLSLEGAFAVLGGLLLLNETLSLRGWIGCALMLAAMLISQWGTFRR